MLQLDGRACLPSFFEWNRDIQMKQITFLSALVLALFLAACGGKSTPAVTNTPANTPTPDLCSSANLPTQVAQVNKLMREFDDYSVLASSTPQQQLVTVIPEMQRVMRDAEDLTVPPCLDNLKKLQLTHMDAVIQTLLAFLNGSDAKAINQGISQARELHSQYDIEMARLLGVTLVPRPTGTPQPTPDANATPGATQPVAFQVLNPGSTDINLRSTPDLNAPTYAVLAAGQLAVALGRTNDNQWIKVQVPDQPGAIAWVYAQLVQTSVPIDQFPVVKP